MTTWLAVIAVILLAFLTFAVGWAKRRAQRRSSEDHSTVPMDLPEATIRSYLIPSRWRRRGAPGAGRGAKEGIAYSRAEIEVVEGPGSGERWTLLQGRTRLGREKDNHVVLDEERISLRHAQIAVRDGVYWLEDLGSTNGTFIGDDTRVMSPYPLSDGERFRLGRVGFVFRGRS